SPALRLPLTAAKAVAPTPKLASVATMIPTAPPPSAAIEPVIGSDAKPIANPSADLLPAFRHAFDQEPRDSFWASEEEPHLSQLMQAAGLPDGSVSEVSCRRSVCRVSFNKAEFGSEVESKLLTSLHQEFGTSVSIEPASLGHDEHAPLYVLRSGYSLESAP
ncbi:MAG TPA: hypothetical protein VHZ95_19670, partial [Polyangiales bacterium]|nr:hypothetical protein [Polyangiales bacterium]